MKDDCIFCKLANGIFATNSIYEDEDFNVIMDANPAAKGHALILPKEHYANIYEIDEEVLGRAMKLAKRIIAHETPILGCDGYNVVQNNGISAGQTVFHFHMHLIPRSEGDGLSLGEWSTNSLSDEEMTALCQAMKL